jgi:hypothetical protein
MKANESDDESLTGQIDSALDALRMPDDSAVVAVASGRRLLITIDDEW